jgi:hypothetical protein
VERKQKESKDIKRGKGKEKEKEREKKNTTENGNEETLDCIFSLELKINNFLFIMLQYIILSTNIIKYEFFTII